MITDHHFGVPGRRHKDGVDATGQRGCEDVADLQTDEECKGNNHHGVLSVRVIGWVCELQVQEGEQGGREANECGAEGEDRPNEAFVD